MRRTTALLLLLLAGCSQPPVALQPGDEIRSEIALAPKPPWPANARLAIGMLLQVHRPGCEVTHLADRDVTPALATMRARVTFFNGDDILGEPIEVPFVRDC